MLAISKRGDMIEIVKTLFNHGAHFNTSDIKFPIFRDCFRTMCNIGNIKIFDFLVKSKRVDIFIKIHQEGSILELIQKS